MPPVQPYHYGSHYSNSGTVLHFLVRMPPFTKMFLAYQGESLGAAACGPASQPLLLRLPRNGPVKASFISSLSDQRLPSSLLCSSPLPVNLLPLILCGIFLCDEKCIQCLGS